MFRTGGDSRVWRFWPRWGTADGEPCMGRTLAPIADDAMMNDLGTNIDWIPQSLWDIFSDRQEPNNPNHPFAYADLLDARFRS